jgi:hypothetical protein
LLTITGCGANGGSFNKTYTVLLSWSSANSIQTVLDTQNAGGFLSPGNYNKVAYPVLYAFASCYNDSTGGVTGGPTRCLTVDYFSFVWNRGGLTTAGGTPNPLASRYWT